MRREKVFILGLDGVSEDILSSFGTTLPFIHSIIKYGAKSVMISTMPPWTPPAWTSIFTGVNPGKHGVFGFHKVIKGKDAFTLRPNTSRDVAVPFLHEALGMWGKKVLAVNVPITWPGKPRRVSRGNTVVVTDWVSPEIKSSHPLPDAIISKFRRALTPATGKTEESRIEIVRKAKAFVNALMNLVNDHDWNAVIAVYSFTDWVMHDNIEFFDSSKRDIHSTEVFVLADEFLKAMYERFDKVVIVSDHGFTLCPSMVNVPYHLIKAELGNPNMREVVNVGHVVIPKTIVRLVKRFRRLRSIARKVAIKTSGGVRVVPYRDCKAVMPDVGAIYVAPNHEDDVKEVLEGIDGVDVLSGKELYWGGLTHLAPDFIVNPAPSYCVNTGEHAPLSKPNTGHSPHGIFAVWGDTRLKYPLFMRPWEVGNALFVEVGAPPPKYGDYGVLGPQIEGLMRFNYALR